MMLPTAPDVVEFVLAHELAHHKLHHVSLWRIVIGVIPGLMVLPGQTTTRAQEYSADRVAMAVCPNHASAMRLLVVGPWMANGVNPEVWAETPRYGPSNARPSIASFWSAWPTRCPAMR